MFPQSIRWRLPLTYAAIAALAALCLGAALLITLRGYYAERERQHLEDNARAVSHLVQRFQTAEASNTELAARLNNLAFITQARIRIVNPDESLVVDTGLPSNMVTIGYSSIDDPAEMVTLTGGDTVYRAIPTPAIHTVEPPPTESVVGAVAVPDSLGDYTIQILETPEEAALYDSVVWSTEAGTAGEPVPHYVVTRDEDTGEITRYTVTADSPPPYDIVRIDGDQKAAWFASTEISMTRPVPDPLQLEPAGAGAFPHLTSFPVAATPFGFDLVGGRTIGVRSDQSVRLPLNDFSGALSGYIELSEGASFGSEIIQNVTVALIFAEGIAIVIAALVGWFISRQISRPVLSLTVGAEQMARGDHAARVRVAGRDEFGKLAHTFNEMAEQVEVTIASLRRFVADAAHELHTPLTALHADLELAATDLNESRRLAYIARARTQAHLLELLTNNLLDLSRLESKTRPASFHPVDVTRLVQELSEVAASRAEQMNQQFKIDAPETPVFVTGDEMQLRRAVINLLDNAIKFTPEGGTVGVAVQRTGSSVSIVVNDTGIGIPADDLPQLFSRFHRGRNANNYPGSGLGLAIIRAIVDGHRGQIEVRSVPGDTRFTMQLPVAS